MFNIPIIGDVIAKVGGVVDNLTTSDEERLKASAELEKIKLEAEKVLTEHMNKVVEVQKETVLAELKSEDKFVRWWRPALMWLCIAILGYNYLIIEFIRLIQVCFDLSFYMPQPIEIPEKIMTLLEIGVGGYIIGRSGEKIAQKWNKK